MLPIIIAEKVLTVAVVLCAIIVGCLTISHGDMSLGLMVLLGQVQTLFGHHSHSRNISHEATHIAIHNKM